jgi:hypothetical protein
VKSELTAIGEPYVINWGRHVALSCGCEISLFCASLIPQPWMRNKSHVPATLCRCGKRYWSWRDKKEFPARIAKEA